MAGLDVAGRNAIVDGLASVTTHVGLADASGTELTGGCSTSQPGQQLLSTHCTRPSPQVRVMRCFQCRVVHRHFRSLPSSRHRRTCSQASRMVCRTTSASCFRTSVATVCQRASTRTRCTGSSTLQRTRSSSRRRKVVQPSLSRPMPNSSFSGVCRKSSLRRASTRSPRALWISTPT
jgi:hypothetical protein